MDIIALTERHEKSIKILRLIKMAEQRNRNIQEWKESPFYNAKETDHALEIINKAKIRLIRAYQNLQNTPI